MSPNLQALFAQATQGPWHAVVLVSQAATDGPSKAVIPELRMIEHDRATYIHPDDASLLALLVTHGEAMVTALEEAHELLYPQYYHSALEQRISTLLATLEREAGGAQ
jgi:hypothetical protein